MHLFRNGLCGAQGTSGSEELGKRRGVAPAENTTPSVTSWSIPPTVRPRNLLVMIGWLLCLLRVTAVAASRSSATFISELWTKLLRPHLASSGEREVQGPPMEAATVIVTGASSGVGSAVVELLAAKQLHVILACRSLRRGLRVAQDIRRRIPSAHLEVWDLDLADPCSILAFSAAMEDAQGQMKRRMDTETALKPFQGLMRRAADKGLHRLCKRVTPGGAPSAENLPPLSTLVHCAAVLPGHPQILPMGMDVTLVTNHLGPMALTMCLIPRLLENAVGRAKPSRVVTVSSFTHRAANLLTALQALEGAKDVFIRREYLPGVDYMNSKLLLTMAARHLHCSYPDLLQSHLADPGAVDSCLIRSWPGWLRLAYRFGLACLWQLNTPKMAASAVEAACLTDAHGGCSRYWFNLRGYAAISSPSHVAQDPGSCRVVWDRTCRAAADFLGSAGA